MRDTYTEKPGLTGSEKTKLNGKRAISQHKKFRQKNGLINLL